jgi:hypothetical protein
MRSSIETVEQVKKNSVIVNSFCSQNEQVKIIFQVILGRSTK